MLVVDRFEGDFAVIETDKGTVDIPRYELPVDAKEGDTIRIVVNKDDTEARKKLIDEKMNRLFKD